MAKRRAAHEGRGRSFSECVESRCGWKESLVDGRSVDGDRSRDGNGFSLDGGRNDGLSGFGGHGVDELKAGREGKRRKEKGISEGGGDRSSPATHPNPKSIQDERLTFADDMRSRVGWVSLDANELKGKKATREIWREGRGAQRRASPERIPQALLDPSRHEKKRCYSRELG